jgi:hypothetical protein
MSRGWHKEEDTSIITLASYFTLRMSEKRNDSLNAKSCVGGKPCLMTISAGVSMSIVWPDITAELPSNMFCRWHLGGWALPVLNEALIEHHLWT